MEEAPNLDSESLNSELIENNGENYKGIFFNDDKEEEIYYEFGSHFPYELTCNKLKKLRETQSVSKEKPDIKVETQDIRNGNNILNENLFRLNQDLNKKSRNLQMNQVVSNSFNNITFSSKILAKENNKPTILLNNHLYKNNVNGANNSININNKNQGSVVKKANISTGKIQVPLKPSEIILNNFLLKNEKSSLFMKTNNHDKSLHESMNKSQIHKDIKSPKSIKSLFQFKKIDPKNINKSSQIDYKSENKLNSNTRIKYINKKECDNSSKNNSKINLSCNAENKNQANKTLNRNKLMNSIQFIPNFEQRQKVKSNDFNIKTKLNVSLINKSLEKKRNLKFSQEISSSPNKKSWILSKKINTNDMNNTSNSKDNSNSNKLQSTLESNKNNFQFESGNGGLSEMINCFYNLNKKGDSRNRPKESFCSNKSPTFNSILIQKNTTLRDKKHLSKQKENTISDINTSLSRDISKGAKYNNVSYCSLVRKNNNKVDSNHENLTSIKNRFNEKLGNYFNKSELKSNIPQSKKPKIGEKSISKEKSINGLEAKKSGNKIKSINNNIISTDSKKNNFSKKNDLSFTKTFSIINESNRKLSHDHKLKYN